MAPKRISKERSGNMTRATKCNEKKGCCSCCECGPVVRIRKAVAADLGAITRIYNEVVRTTTATFDTKPRTVGQQKTWFKMHDAKHPILVVELDGRVVAWASLSRWSERLGYARTAEISLYVEKKLRGLGLGRLLGQAILEKGKELGHHTVITRITDENKASLRLHKEFGFRKIGVMKQVGFKAGRFLDVYLMQLIFKR